MKILYHLNNNNNSDNTNKNNNSDDKEFNENDCLYMHMLFPIKNDEFIKNNINNDINNNNDKYISDSYYEVGCKIFEINKIIN
jgi:hypothetical protein